MRIVIEAFEGEYRRYKSLAERSLAQLSDRELHVRAAEGNSVATLLQHLGGNLASRFTGFPAEDGEKPWRDREAEFEERQLGRDALQAQWENGWRALFEALASLDDGMLAESVSIRGVALSVADALARSLAHTGYHVGQIVLIARGIRGKEWEFLSIPPGGSAAYNANPTLEKPAK